MNVSRTKSLLLAAALLCATHAYSQATGRIMTPTRSVTKYSGLVRELAASLQQKDATGADKYLTPDFEVRSSSRGTPLPKQEWQQGWASGKLVSFEPRDMAVRSFGDQVEIASYTADQRGTFAGKDASGTFFIVDVWQRDGDAWKLAVRYQSKAGAVATHDRKPTGKD